MSPQIDVRFCDELPFGFGWIEDGFLQRNSHALVAGNLVWIVDPVAHGGAEERARALGRPAGVVQLLDRHGRDCAEVAARLAVPLQEVPLEGLPGSPFEVLPIVNLPGWREVALWWAAEGVLVCADALGTAPYYRARDEPLAVHPLLRLTPPRRLHGLAPLHILCGHGEGMHDEEASLAFREALTTSRRRIRRWLGSQLVRGRR